MNAVQESGPMSLILAIESDQQRRSVLMALIREYVPADVTFVDTVGAAIASFEHQQPDLIVAPALLPAEDSDRLSEHVKWHADPHVQMVTISALDMLREAPSEEPQRFAFLRRRRPVSLDLQYEPSMVGRQIADALDRALTRREQPGATLDVLTLMRQPKARLLAGLVPAAASATSTSAGNFRERAERTPHREPLFWSVRMPGGAEAELVNISRTGLLLECASKVSPGVMLELQLRGMGQNRVVMARFVRSDIARVDRFGVRYHAAAQFEEPLAMLRPRAESTPRATPQSLAELFITVASELNSEKDSSVRFAQGLRELIGARDVLIRPTPIAPDRDAESFYFRIGGDDRSGMILQVLLDRHRLLTAAEFWMLKAASGMALALLELKRVSNHDRRLPPSRVAARAKRLVA
jgi:CheY-like chemotaxis protein